MCCLVRYFLVVFIWFGVLCVCVCVVWGFVSVCVCVCVTQGELHLLSVHSVPGTIWILGTQK